MAEKARRLPTAAHKRIPVSHRPQGTAGEGSRKATERARAPRALSTPQREQGWRGRVNKARHGRSAGLWPDMAGAKPSTCSRRFVAPLHAARWPRAAGFHASLFAIASLSPRLRPGVAPDARAAVERRTRKSGPPQPLQLGGGCLCRHARAPQRASWGLRGPRSQTTGFMCPSQAYTQWDGTAGTPESRARRPPPALLFFNAGPGLAPAARARTRLTRPPTSAAQPTQRSWGFRPRAPAVTCTLRRV